MTDKLPSRNAVRKRIYRFAEKLSRLSEDEYEVITDGGCSTCETECDICGENQSMGRAAIDGACLCLDCYVSVEARRKWKSQTDFLNDFRTSFEQFKARLETKRKEDQ